MAVVTLEAFVRWGGGTVGFTLGYLSCMCQGGAFRGLHIETISTVAVAMVAKGCPPQLAR